MSDFQRELKALKGDVQKTLLNQDYTLQQLHHTSKKTALLFALQRDHMLTPAEQMARLEAQIDYEATL